VLFRSAKSNKSSFVNNVASSSVNVPTGVSSVERSYYRRIRKNRPDLYKEVKLGNKKILTAAVEAGYRLPLITFCVNSPDKAATIILKAMQKGKVSKDFIKKMVNILMSKLDEE
jgi:hypothetical protein